MKTTAKIVSAVLALTLLCTTTGVFATWAFSESADDATKDVAVDFSFPQPIEWSGSTLLPAQQANAVQAFVEQVNDENSAIHTYITDRATTTGFFALSRNEIGTMDEKYAEQLKAMLGITGDSDVSMVVRLLKSGQTVIGYEAYTTQVDLSTFTASNFQNENGRVYPVYKTTFVAGGVDGALTPSATTVGWSRTIYYYEGESATNSHPNRIRSFDVTEWTEGAP